METERHYESLSVLFDAVINDLKSSSPIWEELVMKSGKLHSCVKLAVQAMFSFVETLQKLADKALESRGATKTLGVGLTRLCLRQKHLADSIKSLNQSMLTHLTRDLGAQLETWQKTPGQLVKQCSKEARAARADLRKASDESQRLQKKAMKIGSLRGLGSLQGRVELSLADTVAKQNALERMEVDHASRVMIEERARFCFLIGRLRPVLDIQTSLITEMSSLEALGTELDELSADGERLPDSNAQLIATVLKPFQQMSHNERLMASFAMIKASKRTAEQQQEEEDGPPDDSLSSSHCSSAIKLNSGISVESSSDSLSGGGVGGEGTVDANEENNSKSKSPNSAVFGSKASSLGGYSDASVAVTKLALAKNNGERVGGKNTSLSGSSDSSHETERQHSENKAGRVNGQNGQNGQNSENGQKNQNEDDEEDEDEEYEYEYEDEEEFAAMASQFKWLSSGERDQISTAGSGDGNSSREGVTQSRVVSVSTQSQTVSDSANTPKKVASQSADSTHTHAHAHSQLQNQQQQNSRDENDNDDEQDYYDDSEEFFGMAPNGVHQFSLSNTLKRNPTTTTATSMMITTTQTTTTTATATIAQSHLNGDVSSLQTAADKRDEVDNGDDEEVEMPMPLPPFPYQDASPALFYRQTSGDSSLHGPPTHHQHHHPHNLLHLPVSMATPQRTGDRDPVDAFHSAQNALPPSTRNDAAVFTTSPLQASLYQLPPHPLPHLNNFY